MITEESENGEYGEDGSLLIYCSSVRHTTVVVIIYDLLCDCALLWMLCRMLHRTALLLRNAAQDCTSAAERCAVTTLTADSSALNIPLVCLLLILLMLGISAD